MESGESSQERKKISVEFSMAAGDDKINLIDILTEDDEFLGASPLFFDSRQDSFQGFRLSGIGNSQEQNQILPCEFMQPSRPSFLRRSLAWDRAFFDNAGVLDADELSIINKGFRRAQDIRERRSESITLNSRDSSWFEIERLVHESKVVNIQHRLQHVQDIEKLDRSVRNQMKSNQTLAGKSLSVHQIKENMKEETTPVRRQATTSSPTTTRSNNGCSSGKSGFRKGSASVVKTSVAKESMNIRPSGLRPPSPQLRFFNENTPLTSNGTARSSSRTPSADARTLFGSNGFLQDSRISSSHDSSCKRTLKRSNTVATSSSLTADKEIYLKSRNIVYQISRHSRSKNCPNSSSKEETTKRDVLKRTEIRLQNQKPKLDDRSWNRTSNLSRQLGATDMKQQDKVRDIKKGQIIMQSKRNQGNKECQTVRGYSFLKQLSKLSKPFGTVAGNSRKPLADNFAALSPNESKYKLSMN